MKLEALGTVGVSRKWFEAFPALAASRSQVCEIRKIAAKYSFFISLPEAALRTPDSDGVDNPRARDIDKHQLIQSYSTQRF